MTVQQENENKQKNPTPLPEKKKKGEVSDLSLYKLLDDMEGQDFSLQLVCVQPQQMWSGVCTNLLNP